MNNSEKNIAQEASFHDAIYETRDVDRDKVDRLLNYASPAGTFGARLPRMAKAISKALGDVRGKRILVYGCGDDNATLWFARRQAIVDAIDVSPKATTVRL